MDYGALTCSNFCCAHSYFIWRIWCSLLQLRRGKLPVSEHHRGSASLRRRDVWSHVAADRVAFACVHRRTGNCARGSWVCIMKIDMYITCSSAMDFLGGLTESQSEGVPVAVVLSLTTRWHIITYCSRQWKQQWPFTAAVEFLAHVYLWILYVCECCCILWACTCSCELSVL